ncbi:LLM class flavin-dependent oxidoreductase [Halalkalibacter urbisdiaboli]|uniref:LLM class flavin-dependent oxidoreductase n=1 Tax=Halalkalibacter urbisdiaboli TaxID=1960589 RepID=UPI000B42EDA6|nr:LLM class flavin-dependent oxidoreductase [Halalkalibacter urbisdiaboli]
MRLSILDQSPIGMGKSAHDALMASVKLAQLAEKCGYTRYWIAEHHDMASLACSAPEVMLSYIGSKTNHLRIGAGAVLLPHYKPYHVAETYNLLSTLFPNRIDLGIGRAPGGSAEATLALSTNFLENVRHFPNDVKQLLQFLYGDIPNEEMFSKIKATPVPEVPPELWLLGTSMKSAKLAAEYGLAYAFGFFMSDQKTEDIFHEYRQHFKASRQLNQPKTILAISVICAETTERARKLALWYANMITRKELGVYEKVNEQRVQERIIEVQDKMVIGNPSQVKQQLHQFQHQFQIDEIMIVTITPTYEDRLTSYQLIGDVID